MSADEGGDIATAVTPPLKQGVDIKKSENKPAPNAGSGVSGGVATPLGGDGAEEITKEAVKEGVAHNLTPKLLLTTKLLLGSRNFFFSYDWDITRTWSTRRHSASVSLPLHKLVDPLVRFLSRVLVISVNKIQVLSHTCGSTSGTITSRNPSSSPSTIISYSHSCKVLSANSPSPPPRSPYRLSQMQTQKPSPKSSPVTKTSPSPSSRAARPAVQGSAISAAASMTPAASRIVSKLSSLSPPRAGTAYSHTYRSGVQSHYSSSKAHTHSSPNRSYSAPS